MSAPRHDDHHYAPIVVIGVVVFGGLAIGCAGAIGLGLLGRSWGWW